jgi:anthranilate phosphoribosyltransferase
MEALGVNIQLSPERAAQCLREIGICFLYAPDLHSSMKQVQKVRRELRLRTMFNLLGPLTNPAHASGQVVGVYALDMVEKLAEALSMLGLHRALVVHGLDGLDEITITGPTRVAEVRDGSVRTYEVDPEEFGMKRSTLADISGGDASDNAAIVREVLSGKKSPRRDVVLLNSAAALVAAGRANHLTDGIPAAAQSIDSGAAAARLDALVNFTKGEL